MYLVSILVGMKRKYVSIMRSINKTGKIVVPQTIPGVIKEDPADNHILACALAGKVRLQPGYALRVADLMAPVEIVEDFTLVCEEGRDSTHCNRYGIELVPLYALLIHALFWELSFFGTPEERDATREELRQQVKHIEAGEE